MKIWFQNRRAKDRKCKRKQDGRSNRDQPMKSTRFEHTPNDLILHSINRNDGLYEKDSGLVDYTNQLHPTSVESYNMYNENIEYANNNNNNLQFNNNNNNNNNNNMDNIVQKDNCNNLNNHSNSLYYNKLYNTTPVNTQVGALWNIVDDNYQQQQQQQQQQHQQQLQQLQQQLHHQQHKLFFNLEH